MERLEVIAIIPARTCSALEWVISVMLERREVRRPGWISEINAAGSADTEKEMIFRFLIQTAW